MSKDGLRRLPDHVVAPLLRALMCIARTPEARLILRPVEERRPPHWTMEDDYQVMFRGEVVGRIDREPDDRCEVTGTPWRWFLHDARGGSGAVGDVRTRIATGRAATRAEAMASFRRAWDETRYAQATR